MKSVLTALRSLTLLAVASVIAMYPVGILSTATARIIKFVNGTLETFEPKMAQFNVNLGLTALIPSLYSSLDVISRELLGAVSSVTLDAGVARAAVGQAVLSFQSAQATATDITPGVVPPNDGDQTFGNQTLSITKARRVPFRWTGEETLGVNNGGPGVGAMRDAQMQQAMRTLVNEMEADTVAAIRIAASRAFGTPGATPFATNLGDPAQLRKILDDNGAPLGERTLLIDTTAGANLRTLAQLTKVNEAGTTMTLRDGALLDLHGFVIKESAAVRAVIKGTGAAYTTSGTALAVGATDIPLITGTGTVLAGDTVTFAGDLNKYVVAVGVAGPGTISIGAPGLRIAIAAAATAVTVGATATGNLGFVKSAVVLATRAPALPDGGDLATDRITITDPRSGITFEVAMYPQYRQMQYEVSACWGVKGIKANHTAQLLG